MKLAPKCPKMPALGNTLCPVELGRAAGYSLQDIPAALGVKPTSRGMAPIASAALGRGLALQLLFPAKATCHLEAEAL